MRYFEELDSNEMEQIDGGSSIGTALIWAFVGVIAGQVADGIIIASTGKSGGDHFADAFTGGSNSENSFSYTSSANGMSGGGGRF